MRVEFTKAADKEFEQLPRAEMKKVARKLLALENNPYSGKKLEGKLKDRYSLRAWPYRILYIIDPKNQTVYIDTIEHRQGVYK